MGTINNNLLKLKIERKLNKLGSNDYDNIECWQLVQTFNEVQLGWAGKVTEVGEANRKNVEDISILLTAKELKGTNKDSYFESVPLPSDLLSLERVSGKMYTSDCPDGKTCVLYDGEEANLDNLLSDENKEPSFEWGETFKTQVGNRIRIYTEDFTMGDVSIVYYRNPRPISFDGCVDEFDNLTKDVTCEFKNDVVDMLITKTAASLAGDIESINQYQINEQQSNQNN